MSGSTLTFSLFSTALQGSENQSSRSRGLCGPEGDLDGSQMLIKFCLASVAKYFSSYSLLAEGGSMVLICKVEMTFRAQIHRSDEKSVRQYILSAKIPVPNRQWAVGVFPTIALIVIISCIQASWLLICGGRQGPQLSAEPLLEQKMSRFGRVTSYLPCLSRKQSWPLRTTSLDTSPRKWWLVHRLSPLCTSFPSNPSLEIRSLLQKLFLGSSSPSPYSMRKSFLHVPAQVINWLICLETYCDSEIISWCHGQ